MPANGTRNAIACPHAYIEAVNALPKVIPMISSETKPSFISGKKLRKLYAIAKPTTIPSRRLGRKYISFSSTSADGGYNGILNPDGK